MSSHDFFQGEARRKVEAAVDAVEQASSAEVVVTVRRSAGRYGQVDLALGAFVAFGALVVFLLSETEYPLRRIPFYVLAVFGITVFVSNSFAGPRRLFASRRAFASNVAHAARAAFFDQGIARTRGRTGILVFVAVLERRVEVLADVGVDTRALGEGWTSAVRSLEAAVGGRPDVDAFVAALGSLATPLGRLLPHQADDVDELPDAPVTT